MAYSADTFVADEQPTTAKWNKLWTNDASFNDGTGIADSAILTRHIAADNVTSGKIASGAVLLGFNRASADQTGITTVETDLTFATAACTVPTGGRDLILEIYMGTCNSSGGSADQVRMYFKESSTYLGTGNFAPGAAFGQSHTSKLLLENVSAGAHTYKVAAKRVNGSGSFNLNYLGSTNELSIPYFAIWGL